MGQISHVLRGKWESAVHTLVTVLVLTIWGCQQEVALELQQRGWVLNPEPQGENSRG